MTKIKIIAAAAILIAIVITAMTCKTCKPKPESDHTQKTIDSLKSIIAAKDVEIQKLDEIVTYYAGAYDSTAKVNDSLQDIGVKTIIKYRDVRVESDTAEIIEACDSMVREYQAFIFQTKETLKAADSLIVAQQSQISEMGVQNGIMGSIIKKIEVRIIDQQAEIDKWKKLAKRRGRALEW